MPTNFGDLVDVGLRKLLIPWEKNSSKQREYYLCFATESTDPFTVEVDWDEADNYDDNNEYAG